MLRGTLKTWRDSLINLTARNRLLKFAAKPTSAVPVALPDAQTILTRLRAETEFAFKVVPAEEGPYLDVADVAAAYPDVRARPDGTLVTVGEETVVKAALRTLLKRTTQEYMDRGVWILYLAVGVLDWADVDGQKMSSPLLLVPVRLSAASSKHVPTLGPADEDPVINPALALKMPDFDVTLPTLTGDLADLNVTDLLSQVRDAVSEHPEWKVTESVVLSYFSFTKEAMYRDLLDNEAQVLASPLVQALGARPGEAGEDFLFDEIDDTTVDEVAPPETTPLVRDADSSQRACIAAAVAGRSFIMDGPPGTGKSQTISNMIGAAIHAGRTVLFVSEKAAALDVVRDRLTAAGLGNYLLELHSHTASRKQVAAELGRALISEPVPPAGMGAMDRAKVKTRRGELTAYADAMNRVREPLGLSLHHVLGQVSRLHDVPAAPKTGAAPVDLTVETFEAIRETAHALARAWRPAEQGTSFVWRDITATGSLDALLFQASTSLERLRGLTAANTVVADAYTLQKTTDGSFFAHLLSHLTARPAGLPEFWLTADTLRDVDAMLIRLRGDLDRLRAAQSAAEAALAESPRRLTWRAIPAPAALPAVTGVEAASAVRFDPGTADDLTGLAEAFTADASMLDTRADTLAGIARLLGLPAPDTFPAAQNLLTVAAVADAEHRPLRGWLTTDSGVARARSALSTLREAHDTLDAAARDAAPYFTDAALARDDLPDLARRMAEDHRGLAKMGGAYRADKRTVAEFTRDGVDFRDAHGHLDKAAAWKSATERLTAAQDAHAHLLGPYYGGAGTDWAAAEAAWTAAWTVAENPAVRNANADLTRIADYLAADVTPPADVRALVTETRADLTRFLDGLAPAPRLAARPDLRDMTLTDAAAWLRAHTAPARSAAAYAAAVSAPLDLPLTLADAHAHVTRRAAVDDALTALTDAEPGYRETFDGLYDGPATSLPEILSALAWTRTARTLVTEEDSPLTPEQAKAAAQAVPTGDLADAVAAWEEAVELLTDAFAPTREAELREELADYDDAAGLLDELAADTGGREEWFAYTAARAALHAHGLGVAVDFCLNQRIRAAQVPQVIERALLVEWADHHLVTDPALRTVRAEDRDALVAEYQTLDRALVSAATSEIIRAVNKRRPRTDVGEAAIIANEASKRGRHMPVRTLIERTQNVTQALKPVFMMSPMSVSQFLPAAIRFDLVIFDEASQVTPADAINCVYRGSALITAGDQKQLPPTNFFGGATSVDDDEEWTDDADSVFDSVLDQMKGSGAFQSLTLRWHYRSRHEDLISFSNRSFYGGRLITFPGAQENGEDVGVALYQVDGVYARGGSADNPLEAEKVAERVLHHYDTRPGMSCGVVTFSEAQASAVETALEKALVGRPDLERHFRNANRLDAFFVKSLESVQGDERDVMIFSIGYGPDENGKVTMNFGPVTKAGGWRRLNVAVTRARFRNEVVVSFPVSKIPADIKNDNLRHLRTYLDYASRGTAALALDNTGSLGGPESPFEESVLDVIRGWGYDVVPQVGAAGYRIDMAVRHPDYPGAYALGIECDGYTYHSSKTARDRDRLREQVLNGLGWHLHRIWSTAWHRARRTEEDRLRAAIEHACSRPPVGLLVPAASLFTPVTVDTVDVDLPDTPDWARPYRITDVTPVDSWVNLADPSSVRQISVGVTEVATIEGPVHTDVLTQRLKDAWNIGRVTARIKANIRAAITAAGVLHDGDFLSVPSTEITVRTPVDGAYRPIAHVADSELAAALTGYIRDAYAISSDDLFTVTARLFGWGRRTADMTDRLDMVLQDLLTTGKVTGTRDRVTLPSEPTA